MKAVPGYPGYFVTDAGRVFSNRTGEMRELKPIENTHGYLEINVTRDNQKTKRVGIHRMVLLAFVGDPPTNEHETRHLDGNRKANRLSNLLWGTRKEQQEDVRRHGTRKNPNQKLTDADVANIRTEYEAGMPRIDICHVWGISESHAYNIVNNLVRVPKETNE